MGGIGRSLSGHSTATSSSGPSRQCPGVELGDIPPVTPAEVGDERVEALVRALDGHLWRGWSLARLYADLNSLLEGWQEDRESLESDLRRLLEGH